MTKEDIKAKLEWEGSDYLFYDLRPKDIDEPMGQELLKKAQRAISAFDDWLERDE